MSLLLLVEIELTDAKLDLFERYENAVLCLLPQFEATLIARVRALDDQHETHLIEFPDEARFKAFQAAPDRVKIRPLWEQSGARSTIRKVRTVE